MPHLNFLVNYCIKLSCFPNDLKRAHVVPLYKKDDPEEPNNYRPISITPCLSKIIETILRDQICQFVHDNKLLSENQYGFRKKFSTIDSLLFCTEFIRNNLTLTILSQQHFLTYQKLLILSIMTFWISS